MAVKLCTASFGNYCLIKPHSFISVLCLAYFELQGKSGVVVAEIDIT